jgi:tellurite methyltransferase
MDQAHTTAPSTALREQFGDIDIYLFDQILRGGFDERRRVLDAGCGSGRNVIWFLRHGFDVSAIDVDPSSIAGVRALAAHFRPDLAADRFRVGTLEALPWPDASMDAVVCSAVLHFAPGEEQFARMLAEQWRVLARGGLFFARLASSIGLEHRLQASTGRVRLPDGTDRFVVSEQMLLDWTERLGATLADPIKTTNVQNLRSMTTWCLEKR